MTHAIRFRRSATALTLGLALLLAGCKSDDQKAMEQAKAQAAATGTAQQIQYIDKNGDTVTTTVQPPVPGQAQQVATQITSPPPGPPPHRTRPVVTPVGGQVAAPVVPQTSASAPPYGPAPASDALAGTPAPVPALNLSVPAGTELAVRLDQRIDVKHAAAGEHFSGQIVAPVSENGGVVIPPGTPVRGRIDAAHRRGHFKGRSILELRLVSMTLNGNEYGLDTHDTVRTKKGKGKRSSAFIGGMTGAGMLIGGIASGGVGLAIGGASGAGAGTLLAGATGNRDIVLPAESIVHFRLADALVVQNP